MLNTEMLTKLRAFLDEATEDFYIDDDDLYGALTDAQLELAKDVANVWDTQKRKLMLPIPLVIRDLLDTATGTIASGANSFNLTDIILLVSLKWNPNGAVTAGKNCTFVGSAGAINKLLENRFLTGGYYFWAESGLVYVNPVSADNTASYSFVYLDTPTDISSSVQPVIQEVGHDAVVERACWIILKDRESEQAQAHLQMYGNLLQGLV